MRTMAQHGTIWDCLTSSYIHGNQLRRTESRSNAGLLHFVSIGYQLRVKRAGWVDLHFLNLISKTWEVKSRIYGPDLGHF